MKVITVLISQSCFKNEDVHDKCVYKMVHIVADGRSLVNTTYDDKSADTGGLTSRPGPKRGVSLAPSPGERMFDIVYSPV